jgi:hypothetical protein
MIRKGEMAPAEITVVKHLLDDPSKDGEIIIASDILKARRQDRNTWENFRNSLQHTREFVSVG